MSNAHPGAATVIGIDFGATFIKAAAVTPEGRVVRRRRIPTVGSKGPDGLLDDLARLVDTLGKNQPIEGVGIGFCGMVDVTRQVVRYTTDTLPGWENVPLAEGLRDRCGLPCVCDNDGNVAALGEFLVGAGVGTKSMVLFTLGTGVGGGVVVDGQLLQGASDTAGHLGHLKVRAGGRRCPCGARGCLEAYASAWAFRRAMHAEPPEVFRLARAGDEQAESVVRKAAWALGRAFADIACTINPEMIVIGGGMARSWAMLKKEAMIAFAQNALRGATQATTVQRTKLGNDAGVIGAALRVLGLPRDVL